MRDWRLTRSDRVQGTLRVPGDKSISHRALLLGALAHGTTEVRGFLRSQDCLATWGALTSLGVRIEEGAEGLLSVHGRGPEALCEPEAVLDTGNSGTTFRLLAGLLAGRPFLSLLTGDASLRGRPMRRVVEPLAAMGATVLGRADGQYPPLAIRGGGLQGISWSSPVASAQVKSAILLAGLQAPGETTVTEPVRSRDHTERMLEACGAALWRTGTTVGVRGGVPLRPAVIRVPGDLSSAAFLLVAGAVRPSGQVQVLGMGVNPTRTGLLDVLERMGARLTYRNRGDAGGEPVADVEVAGGRLRGVRVGAEAIPRLIDEIPALAVAAALADGETVLEGVGELRVKEVDRLAALAGELSRLGARLRVTGDALAIQGGAPLRGSRVSSRGDHRMAMSLAVAALFADGESVVEDVACVETSYPGFRAALTAVAPACEIREIETDG
jgi:3-phosphoshikimate 1-carboxyvinyltransferase